MFKNVASQSVTILALDTATGLPKTGDASNITLYYNGDNGGVTVFSTGSGHPTEDDATNSPGTYTIAATQGETNFNRINISGKSSTSGIRIIPSLNIQTVPAAFANVAGAANGLTICGSNAATTFATLTSTGAFTTGGFSAGAVTATLFTLVAVAAPSVGVTSVGELLNTTFTVPVDDVTPVPPLATARVPVVSEIAPVVATVESPDTSDAAIAKSAFSWLAVQSSGTPVPAVVRHFVVAFAMLVSLALLTVADGIWAPVMVPVRSVNPTPAWCTVPSSSIAVTYWLVVAAMVCTACATTPLAFLHAQFSDVLSM